jgi:hypothetical protein
VREHRAQRPKADQLAASDDDEAPWVVSWVDYLLLLRRPSYSSYRIPLNFLSYGLGTAVNSRLNSWPCSFLSSTTPAIPFARCCGTHEPFESILVGILLYNYYLCITTDPGVVPHNWVRHAPPSTAFFAYADSYRNQNLTTQMGMRSRSCLVSQGIVACAEGTNHRVHITARLATGTCLGIAILPSEH